MVISCKIQLLFFVFYLLFNFILKKIRGVISNIVSQQYISISHDNIKNPPCRITKLKLSKQNLTPDICLGIDRSFF